MFIMKLVQKMSNTKKCVQKRSIVDNEGVAINFFIK